MCFREDKGLASDLRSIKTPLLFVHMHTVFKSSFWGWRQIPWFTWLMDISCSSSCEKLPLLTMQELDMQLLLHFSHQEWYLGSCWLPAVIINVAVSFQDQFQAYILWSSQSFPATILGCRSLRSWHELISECCFQQSELPGDSGTHCWIRFCSLQDFSIPPNSHRDMHTHRIMHLRIHPVHSIQSGPVQPVFFTSLDCLNSYPQSCLTKPLVSVSQTFMSEIVKVRRGKQWNRGIQVKHRVSVIPYSPWRFKILMAFNFSGIYCSRGQLIFPV